MGRTIIMKPKGNRIVIAVIFLIATLGSVAASAQEANDEQLLRVRETVWRAWFAGDTKTFEKLVPPESVVMSGGEDKWKNQADVLHSAAEFHAKGGKLVRLNSLAPKFSTSAMSPSFGGSIWPRRKQTANARSIPAVSP